MDDPSQLSEYGKILIFGVVGTLLVSITLFFSKIISPHKPNPLKVSTYECGEESRGTAWVQFNSRFYIIALIFLIFEVELIFIFPWATVFGDIDLMAADSRWSWFTIVEMFAFLAILALGLIYVWAKGDLEWVRPNVKKPIVAVNIPTQAYAKLNQRKYGVRDHRLSGMTTKKQQIDTVQSAHIGFRPTFRKK